MMLIKQIVVVAFLLLGLLLSIYMVSKEKIVNNETFDERQILYRNKGYKWGFSTMVVTLVVCQFSASFLENYLSLDSVLVLVLGSGFTVALTYWIWNDAYYKPKEYRSFIWPGLFSLAMAALGMKGAHSDYQVWLASEQGLESWKIFLDEVAYKGTFFLTELSLGLALLTKFVLEKRRDEE
ncbi:hypothetical protein ACVR1I_07550 [Streptococcus cameli]